PPRRRKRRVTMPRFQTLDKKGALGFLARARMQLAWYGDPNGGDPEEILDAIEELEEAIDQAELFVGMLSVVDQRMIDDVEHCLVKFQGMTASRHPDRALH